MGQVVVPVSGSRIDGERLSMPAAKAAKQLLWVLWSVALSRENG